MKERDRLADACDPVQCEGGQCLPNESFGERHLWQGEELRLGHCSYPLSAPQPHLRIQNQQHWSQIGWVYGITRAVIEQCMELILPIMSRACCAALQPATQQVAAEIPAASALQQVAAKGRHISQLRRSGDGGCLSQQIGSVLMHVRQPTSDSYQLGVLRVSGVAAVLAE